MAATPKKLSRLWQELKRRNVFRVITVYAGAAFVTLELVDIIADPLKLPTWFLPVVIVLLSVGFIIAIILSWIYDIRSEGGLVKTEPADKVDAGDTARSSNSWKIASYISFVVIVALIVLNFIPLKNTKVVSDVLDKSIAILPFHNDSPDQENEYFINGTMESILNNLCKIKDLRVVSRSSVEQFRDTTVFIPDVAEFLNACFILEGGMSKYGNHIRMTLQLIDRNDRHVWSEQYDREVREVEDLLSLQSEIAQLVAEQLQAVITPEERERIEKVPTSSLTAFEYYLRASEEQFSYGFNIDNTAALDRAASLYRRSLNYDPGFSLAYSGLAWNYFWRDNYMGMFGTVYSKDYFEEEQVDSVLILVERALQLDDQNVDALIIRGYVYLGQGNLDKTEEYVDRALELNSNHPQGLILSTMLSSSDKGYIHSIQMLERAMKIEKGIYRPMILDWYYHILRYLGITDKCETYLNELTNLTGDSARYFAYKCKLEILRGNTEKASDYTHAAFRIDTNSTYGILIMGDHYYDQGQYREAYAYYKKHFDRLEEAEQVNPNYMPRMAHVLLEIGQKEKAMTFFNKWFEMANECIQRKDIYGQSGADYDLAGVYALLGNKEKAYEHLEAFLAGNYQSANMIIQLKKRDPLFESIRHEERFQQIVRDAEAKHQAEQERVRKWLEENDLL